MTIQQAVEQCAIQTARPVRNVDDMLAESEAKEQTAKGESQ